MKLYDNVVTVRPENSELEQWKYYLKGIGAYDIDHLSSLEHVGNTIYSRFKIALVWFMLHKHLFHD